MFRHALSFAVSLLLISTMTTHFAFAKLTAEAKLKQKIVEWGTNKNVSVKLKSGSKIEGRIADINDTNFVLQLVENGQVVARSLAYSDVHKISTKGEPSGGSIAGWIALGAGVGVATLIFIGLAVGD